MLPRRAWYLLASLYSTQFLGLMFFVVAIVAILREGGASMDTIGLIYLLGMAWPLKVLWAPWIDRHATWLRGHYRGWLLLLQAGLVLSLAALSTLDLRSDFGTIYTLCLAMALLSGAQDVAVDGLATRLFSNIPAQRGMGNALQIAGNMVGNCIGGGVMLMCYATIGWQDCCLLLAALTAVSWVQLLGYREPVWPRSIEPAGHARLLTFWRGPQRKRWLLLLLLYSAAASLAYAVLTPSLLDAGWSLYDIGLTVNILGSVAGLATALLYGRALRRWPRRRAIVTAALLQIAGVAGLALPASGASSPILAGAAAILYFMLYTPGATVLSTLIMDHSSTQSPATDYALQFSMNHCFSMLLSFAGAMLAQRIGYSGVIAVSVVLALFTVGASLSWTPQEAV